MSTATPPQTYFPQKNATPTMKHGAPSVGLHFRHGPHHVKHAHGTGRKHKTFPGSAVDQSAKDEAAKNDQGLGLSFEDLGLPQVDLSRQTSIASTHSSSTSYPSSRSYTSASDRSDSSIPSASASIPSISSVSTRSDSQLLTPVSSEPETYWVDERNVVHREVAEPVMKGESKSWVGKMAVAVVNTGIHVRNLANSQNQNQLQSTSAQRAKPKPRLNISHSQPVSPALTTSPLSSVRQQSVPHIDNHSTKLSNTDRKQVEAEWEDGERKRIHECARLCSQWPQSGYNLTKHGPKGASVYYQPQSFCNPIYVANVMQRQAALEHHLCATSGTFFACRLTRSIANRFRGRGRGRESGRDSDEETEPSVGSEACSNSSSPSASFIFGNAADKTAAELREAMASSLMELSASPKSIQELDELAKEMVIAKPEPEGESIDLDQALETASQISTDPNRVRAQSCGAKRSCSGQAGDEEKRRKVDEAMVIEEAVETGVILPPSMEATSRPKVEQRLSASVPDLSKVKAVAPPAVFGMVVKTSESHPIIISPFFPAELLPILSQHLVLPLTFSNKSLLLNSRIDVPSLLLSFTPPTPNSLDGIVPSPVQSSFRKMQIDEQKDPRTSRLVGNLLLSSCPGKRLRMDGPHKGRGPVCRDLAVDLRRIKSEGVGCLVCCLDDEELALLGVPWETYRDVAAETELDVIRLPMPDGFTPVSMELFDSQVNLIASKYTLQGINVLVHCRGGVGRAGMTACAWAIKMGFVQPHPSLAIVEEASRRHLAKSQDTASTPRSGTASPFIKTPTLSTPAPPAELEHQIVMSIVERVIAMIRCRRGLKAIESFEQVEFLTRYVGWLRESARQI